MIRGAVRHGFDQVARLPLYAGVASVELVLSFLRPYIETILKGCGTRAVGLELSVTFRPNVTNPRQVSKLPSILFKIKTNEFRMNHS